MQSQFCPHCQEPVSPSPDGSCPVCGGFLTDAGSPDAETAVHSGDSRPLQAGRSPEPVSALVESLNPMREVGDVPRIVSGWLMGAIAVLFTLPVVFCPVAMVIFAVRGEWKTVGGLGIAALVSGLVFAAPLYWFARRLLRPRPAGKSEMVLPLWLIQGMGVLFIGCGCLSAYQLAFNPKSQILPRKDAPLIIGSQLLLGAGMLFYPWLQKRYSKPPANVNHCRTCGDPLPVADASAAAAAECPRCQTAVGLFPGGDSSSASPPGWGAGQINPYSSPGAGQLDDASVAVRPPPSDTLAWIALALPLLAVAGECFTSSPEVVWTLSIGSVVVTSILIAIDALQLGPRESSSVGRNRALGLLLGGMLFWVAVYPMAFFRRRQFGATNLGWVSLVVAVIFLGLPVGLYLLIPSGLPACDAPEVKQLLVQIVADSPTFKQRPAFHPRIDGHREVNFDTEKQIRTGKCTLHTEDGESPLTYTVTWHDREKRLFNVQVLGNGILPACDSPEVQQVLLRIVSDLPRFKKRPPRNPRTVGHRQISFDSDAQIRTGKCTLQTDDGDFPLTFTVTWQDDDKKMFYVQAVEE